MDITNTSLIAWGFGLAAFGYLSLSIYLLSFGSDWQTGTRPRRMVIVASFSTLWALAGLFYALNTQALLLITSALADVIRYGAWYAFIIALLGPTGDSNTKPLLPTWLPLTCWLLVMSGIALRFRSRWAGCHHRNGCAC